MAAHDYEQAGELKIGQVGIANLRIRTLDVDQLVREMRERVERAPKLFGRAAVIVDFGGLAQLPDPATAGALIDGLRDAGNPTQQNVNDVQRKCEQNRIPHPAIGITHAVDGRHH